MPCTPDRTHALIPRREMRAISRVQGATSLDIARIDRVEELQKARLQALGSVTRSAMFEAQIVSKIEIALSDTMPPLMVTRLRAIAEVGVIGMAEIVSDTVRQVSR